MDMIYTYHGHLLTNLNQSWLSPADLQMFADAIHNKGAALDNCWGFVDGIVTPIFRTIKNQRVLYNGHKRGPLTGISISGCSKWTNSKFIWSS